MKMNVQESVFQEDLYWNSRLELTTIKFSGVIETDTEEV